MKVDFVRSAFNYDADAVSLETATVLDGPSMTQQQFAEEVDINTIVRRFGLTGTMPQSLAMPKVGDFTGVTDFHAAMNLVKAAESEFLKVPAEVRARFGNDPQAFMRFFEDEANRPEAVRLGLVVDKEVTRDVSRETVK